MNIHTKWLDHDYNGQTMRAYVAKPQNAQGNLPGVLVIHEIFGVDEHIIDVAERVAESGYFVIAPDLYSHGPTEISPEHLKLMKYFLDVIPAQSSMDAKEREKWPREVRETFETLAPTSIFGKQPEKTNSMVQSLVGWAQYLRDQGATSVASIGFCLGGGLSFHLAASYTELKGAVVYYGDSPTSDLMESIRCPVLGFYGGADHRITDTVPSAQDAMKKLGKEYSCQIYDGVGHAFFNDTRKSYKVDAARDAWAKTLYFLNRVLI